MEGEDLAKTESARICAICNSSIIRKDYKYVCCLSCWQIYRVKVRTELVAKTIDKRPIPKWLAADTSIEAERLKAAIIRSAAL